MSSDLPSIASARMQLLPPYLFGELNRIKMEKRRAGEDIIDFGMGNPSDPTPDWVVEKLCEVARDPRNHRYSVSTGIFNLKREAARFYGRRYGVELDPEKEVVCTIGSKEGLSHLCLALLGPGESVMVPTPAFPIHVYAPIIAGANVIGVSMGEGSSAECAERVLRGIDDTCQHISPKPKAVIVCYPHNPTARVAERPFYEKLVALARRHEFLVIHDFGLKRLTNLQSSDFYEVIIERHQRSSTIVTSNRTIGEWIPLFDDPILAQSALDGLAHNAYQIVIEGDSYRSKQRPRQAKTGTRKTPKPRKN